MKCALCGSKKVACVDSRDLAKGRRRRYECGCCGSRFTTLETHVGEPTPPELKIKHAAKFNEEQSTICWKCQKAVGLCAWSHSGEPVEGWEAKETNVGRSHEGKIKSYLVISCPQFVKD